MSAVFRCGPHRSTLKRELPRMPDPRRLANGMVAQPYWAIASIGERIRAARKKRGLTVPELGSLVGIHEQSVWQIEAGDYNPRWPTLLKIAKALGAEVRFIVPRHNPHKED